MESLYTVTLYTGKKANWMSKYQFKEKSTQDGTYYTALVTKKEKSKITRKADSLGIRYKITEKQWTRSTDYRATFLKHNPGPYRCTYCHKRLTKDQLYVDHLVPVAAVKNRGMARTLLYMQGIKNINDHRNLVPACFRCNSKKSSKMGLWFVRGRLGRYKLYWWIRRIIILAVIAMIAYGGYFIYTNYLQALF